MHVANSSRPGLWPWAAAAALVVGNLLLHKSISDVCDALFARLGRGPYERASLLAIGALSAAGAAVLLRRRAGALARPRVLIALLALAALTAASFVFAAETASADKAASKPEKKEATKDDCCCEEGCATEKKAETKKEEPKVASAEAKK